jgi:hypothetical protein
VTEGTQFDRSAQFYLGGANIFLERRLSRALTSALVAHVKMMLPTSVRFSTLHKPGRRSWVTSSGSTDGVTYDGIIYGNATLLFYPAGSSR